MEPQNHQRSQFLRFVAMAGLVLVVIVSNLSCAPAGTERPTVQVPSETPLTEPTEATQAPAATEEPVTATVGVGSTQPVVHATLSLEEELERVQVELNKFLKGNLKYTAPSTMKLNESFLMEVRLNPSLSADELATQIVESGGLVTSTADPDVLLSTSGAEVRVVGSEVEITSLMKAVLISDDPQAFDLQPLHDNDIQPVGKDTTTTWQWLITARKAGTHRLILTIYRQVTINGENYWPTVITYREEIDINVTFGQWLGSLDWNWILGVLVTALLVPAFWRWIDQRRKRNEEAPKPKPQKKKG